MFKDIILAVTPSAVCENAAEKAFAFAKRFDSKLYMVNVCGMSQGWGAIEHLESDGTTRRIEENMKLYYADKTAELDHCDCMVTAGIPHNEILRIARKKNADLIVMGPHTKEYEEKRSKMWGMAGSTLERVSQRARCPVMIVAKESAAGHQEFGVIFAATDFSDQAECAVAYAGQMARHYKSALLVFHVVEDGDAGAAAEAERRLKDVYGARLAGVKSHRFAAVTGDPAMEILKASKAEAADLVIMAHHTKEADPEKAFLGSVVSKVALNAGCPTMSVNRHFDLRCGLMYDQTGAVTDADAETKTEATV